MKKAIFMAAAILCAVLSSCTKDIKQASSSKDIKFNITVADVNPATKAIKQEWADGDKLNLWFNGSTLQTPDLVITYNASGDTWQAGDLRSGIDADYFDVEGGYCVAFYEAYNDLGRYSYAGSTGSGHFSYSKTLGGADYSQIPMLVCGVALYTFDDNTVTATVGSYAWCHYTDLQVVVTGLDSAEAGSYTLSCPGLKAITSFYPTLDCGYDPGAAVAGVSNADGVAFYFDPVSSAAQDYTFTLTDYTGAGDPVVKTFTATNKTLDSDGETKCVGIKIAYSKFATAAPAAETTGTTDGHDWVQLWAGGPKFATMNLGETEVTGNTQTYAWTATGSSDAAATNWSDNWRVPTQEQLQELLNAASEDGSDKVSCEYTNSPGVYGFLFTGTTTGYTGNSIFLSGVADDCDSSFGYGDYWSGSEATNAQSGIVGGWNLALSYDSGELLSTGGLAKKVDDRSGEDVKVFVRPVLK